MSVTPRISLRGFYFDLCVVRHRNTPFCLVMIRRGQRFHIISLLYEHIPLAEEKKDTNL
jgi:hypothetical protein